MEDGGNYKRNGIPFLSLRGLWKMAAAAMQECEKAWEDIAIIVIRSFIAIVKHLVYARHFMLGIQRLVRQNPIPKVLSVW